MHVSLFAISLEYMIRLDALHHFLPVLILRNCECHVQNNYTVSLTAQCSFWAPPPNLGAIGSWTVPVNTATSYCNYNSYSASEPTEPCKCIIHIIILTRGSSLHCCSYGQVTFTRRLYAQLLREQFRPPTKAGFHLYGNSVAHELGMKLVRVWSMEYCMISYCRPVGLRYYYHSSVTREILVIVNLTITGSIL